MIPSIDATYGVWLVSLVIGTILYGAGMLQVWMYFSASPTDPASIKWTVSIVAVLETVQVIFFSVSSYSRFVKLFGKPQTNLVWADSLQLLCAYLSAFVVQLFFANRIIKLTKGRGKFSLKAFGIYVILALALIEILAGITQVAWTYQIRSYLKLDQTKAVITLQSAASLRATFSRRTNKMVDALVYDAINRGTLTAMSSLVTMVLFLVLPDTFWFFLGLAPSSKLYMNSMLATSHIAVTVRSWTFKASALITTLREEEPNLPDLDSHLKLIIDVCHAIESDFRSTIGSYTHLSTLDVTGFNFSPEFCQTLTSLPNLSIMDIRECEITCPASAGGLTLKEFSYECYTPLWKWDQKVHEYHLVSPSNLEKLEIMDPEPAKEFLSVFVAAGPAPHLVSLTLSLGNEAQDLLYRFLHCCPALKDIELDTPTDFADGVVLASTSIPLLCSFVGRMEVASTLAPGRPIQKST
ncbi:hypothetical protein C8R43DRAFT_1245183 [Mycena crocata]|nr:hypothetical protein C8R43DRAFT_1245183 [Mycena crocata]